MLLPLPKAFFLISISYTITYVDSLHLVAMSTCSFCARLAQPEFVENPEPKDAKNQFIKDQFIVRPSLVYHHQCILSLIKSSHNCPLCKFFVCLLGEQAVREAREAALKGDYTRAIIRTRRVRDPCVLLKTVTVRILEVFSSARVWSTPSFEFCTNLGT